jgi:cell division ATPase FtsA
MDSESLVAVCQKALTQAEEMAQASDGRWVLPDQILVGLPASRLRGRAWSIGQRRSHPERPVDEGELTALLARTLRLATNRLRDENPDDAGWLLLDAVVVALTVDGHGVTDPVGFRGQEIGATVFAALAQSEVIKSWGVVARELEFSALTLTASPLALAVGLSAPQAILIDIGGTTTDLIWCRAGRPVVLDSLSIGGAELTRSLANKWGLLPDRAERLKKAYSSGGLPAEARAEVQGVLWPGLQAWFEQMEAALARLNRDEPLPQHLLLLGGGSALPQMAEAVCSLAWSQRLHFTRYPQVRRLQPTDVPGVVNRTGQGRQMGDLSALALAAWAAQQQRPSERPARILNELCQE